MVTLLPLLFKEPSPLQRVEFRSQKLSYPSYFKLHARWLQLELFRVTIFVGEYL
jgi:hypothetical protein